MLGTLSITYSMASVWLGLPSRLIELTEPTSSTLAVPRTKRAASLHSGLLSVQKKCILIRKKNVTQQWECIIPQISLSLDIAS